MPDEIGRTTIAERAATMATEPSDISYFAWKRGSQPERPHVFQSPSTTVTVQRS